MIVRSESLTYSKNNKSRPRSCHKGGIKMKVNSAGNVRVKNTQFKCVLQTKGHYSENGICSPSWLSSASPTSTPCESTCPWPSSPWSTTAPSSRRTPCPTLLTLAPCRRVRKNRSPPQIWPCSCQKLQLPFQIQPITATRVRTAPSIGIGSNRAQF